MPPPIEAPLERAVATVERTAETAAAVVEHAVTSLTAPALADPVETLVKPILLVVADSAAPALPAIVVDVPAAG
jgi:hypothetical protein